MFQPASPDLAACRHIPDMFDLLSANAEKLIVQVDCYTDMHRNDVHHFPNIRTIITRTEIDETVFFVQLIDLRFGILHDVTVQVVHTVTGESFAASVEDATIRFRAAMARPAGRSTAAS